MNQSERQALNDYAQRVAALERQKKEIADDIKAICDNCKDTTGTRPKVLKQLAKEINWTEIERMDQWMLEEELDECRSALGLLADTPLGEAAQNKTKRVRRIKDLEPAGTA